MHQIFERDGKVVLAWPEGEIELDALAAHRIGYALMECARFSVTSESGDPKRAHIWEIGE